MFRVISCGIPTGLATSSAAPIGDMLRMVQSALLPSNSIVPAFKTRRRGFARRSSMPSLLKPKSSNGMNGDRKIGLMPKRIGNRHQSRASFPLDDLAQGLIDPGSPAGTGRLEMFDHLGAEAQRHQLFGRRLVR